MKQLAGLIGCKSFFFWVLKIKRSLVLIMKNYDRRSNAHCLHRIILITRALGSLQALQAATALGCGGSERVTCYLISSLIVFNSSLFANYFIHYIHCRLEQMS